MCTAWGQGDLATVFFFGDIRMQEYGVTTKMDVKAKLSTFSQGQDFGDS